MTSRATSPIARRRFLALAARAAAWLPALAALAWAGAALARVGGGDTYRRPSPHPSGGGSSGGDSDGLFFLVWLLLNHPGIAVPIVIIVGVFWLYGRAAGGASRAGWETAPQGPAAHPTLRARSAAAQLEGLRRFDPAFSRVLFEDFLYALYARAHEARGGGRLDELSAYLAPASLDALKSSAQGLVQVRGIVVGAMQLAKVRGLDGDSAQVSVSVRFESNYTEVRSGGEAQTYYSAERWTLERRRDARSRPPERARRIGCPACGAPLEAVRGEVCSYCQKVVNTGEFDWRVQSVELVSKEPQPPALTTSVQEQGTELPTVLSENLQEGLAELASRDPQFGLAHFQARAALIFGELQAAWSSRDWTRSRPFVTDNLFQMQLYWIETFERLKVRNVLDELRILGFQVAAVQADPYYDIITARIFAQCLDYYRSDDGRVLSGSATRARRFSEYWTFVRGRGKVGPSKAERACPNCGAPLQINQAGICEYCKAKVTTGEFDWVLSRIEQDEAYQG